MRLHRLAGGPRARLLALAFGLAVGALTLSASGLGQRPPASPPRTLSKTDEEREKELRAKAVAFGRVGKYKEAQGPVREILELRTRTLGEKPLWHGRYPPGD